MAECSQHHFHKGKSESVHESNINPLKNDEIHGKLFVFFQLSSTLTVIDLLYDVCNISHNAVGSLTFASLYFMASGWRDLIKNLNCNRIV